jgi:hypothetical protein
VAAGVEAVYSQVIDPEGASGSYTSTGGYLAGFGGFKLHL